MIYVENLINLVEGKLSVVSASLALKPDSHYWNKHKHKPNHKHMKEESFPFVVLVLISLA